MLLDVSKINDDDVRRTAETQTGDKFIILNAHLNFTMDNNIVKDVRIVNDSEIVVLYYFLVNEFGYFHLRYNGEDTLVRTIVHYKVGDKYVGVISTQQILNVLETLVLNKFVCSVYNGNSRALKCIMYGIDDSNDCIKNVFTILDEELVK